MNTKRGPVKRKKGGKLGDRRGGKQCEGEKKKDFLSHGDVVQG